MCLNRLTVSRNVMIGDIVLLTQLLNMRSQSWQMAVIDIGEQMMLDLIIQSSRKVIAKQAIVPKILSSLRLVLIKVFIGSVRTFVRQVIDLSVYHEANAHDNPRYS